MVRRTSTDIGGALIVFFLGFGCQFVQAFYSSVGGSRRNRIAYSIGSSSSWERMANRFEAAKDDDWTDVPKKKKANRAANRNGSGNRAPKQHKDPHIEVLAPTNHSDNTGTNYQPQHHEPFLVLLVGLPGSGKSTFSQSLVASMPGKFCRINQDELKTRPKCERKLEKVLSIPTTQEQRRCCPIIDRCNFDQKQRSTWYRMAEAAPGQGVSASNPMASNPPTEDSAPVDSKTEECGAKRVETTTTIEATLEAMKFSSPPSTTTTTTTTTAKGVPVDVVLLDLPYDECLRRCSMRKGHETIQTPQQASRVLNTLRRQWSPPNHPKNKNERFKYRSLTVVRTDRERTECLQKLLDQTH